jgi:hypothetical protein
MRSVSETSDSDFKDAPGNKEISSPASVNGDEDSAASTAPGTSPASVNGDGDSVTDTTAAGTSASKEESAMLQAVNLEEEESVAIKGKNSKKNQRRKAKKAEAKALAPLMVAAAEAAKAAGPPTLVDFETQATRRLLSDLSLDERSKLKTSLLNMLRAEEALKSAKEVERDDAAKVPVGGLTPLQLAEYGPAADRILVSVYGDIFDVSNEREKYGIGGSKMEFAGKDLTWNLICGGMGDTNLFFDLYKAEKQSDVHDMLNSLCRWLLLFEKRHGQPVGRLNVYGSMEKELAAPPPKQTECSIM